MDLFLSPPELAMLTGRKVKSKQVDALRKMGIAFFVNAAGKPVVTRSAVEGGKEIVVRASWQPKALAK